MRVSRGKKHDYFGMQLDFTENGKVKFTMDDYVVDMVRDFHLHDKTTRTAKTPTAEHLFRVNNDTVPLPQEGIPIFHNFVAHVLFLTKCAQPAIATAVAFLTTRVQKPNKDDWKKTSLNDAIFTWYL